MSYETGITLKKMFYQALYAGISAFITAGINYIQALPVEQNATVFALLMVFLQGAQNYLKHRND